MPGKVVAHLLAADGAIPAATRCAGVVPQAGDIVLVNPEIVEAIGESDMSSRPL